MTTKVFWTSTALLLATGRAVWLWTPSLSPQVTEIELQNAADALLDAVNPTLRSNAYFPSYAKDKLRWLNIEHAAGRLDVRFFHDTPANALPADIVMASMYEGDHGVIFLSTKRLAADLLDTGGVRPPFNARQRNDFMISLVHEIVHLQYAERDEFRVWSEVNAQVVRPLRELSQPMHPRFQQVDGVLRACRDRLPCQGLELLVRLHR